MAVTIDRPATETQARTGQLTREQRAARGKAAREKAPRSSHAEFNRDPRRPDPLTLLTSQEATRVADLLPIRYGRMAVSPFTFFRGAALPMASDLATTPQTGLRAQICGDAHLANFGLFASPERKLVFDINDFDETLPGPWEWDVKRLSASLEIAARNNNFTRKQRREIQHAMAAQYRAAMHQFATSTTLEVWYAHADVAVLEQTYAQQLKGSQRRRLDKTTSKARTKDNLGALRKFTEFRDGQLRIASDPPLIVQVDELIGSSPLAAQVKAELRRLLASYRETLEPERRILLDRYRYVDLARKVVGVGSVGTRCWMLLMLGNDDEDPLFLQAKQAGPSVLEEFAGASEFDQAGQRVVVGQRLMQTVSDIFLGWVRVTTPEGPKIDYYIRQLRDWKGSADIDAMVPFGMREYGRLCAWTLARAHARTGDAIALAAYLGNSPAFDTAIAEFSATYADQNERDHAELTKAIREGRITAVSGE